ncbi:NADH dehydrogenase [Kluyvera cryocrescens]|uniref:NADH dehydrogenase n=1 Tax=Kluyvera cryocrescens TaxID=580 RepID=A0A485A4L3_KLUCR|nr:NADH dehydrogenase [Kluyvera cryocrescens]
MATCALNNILAQMKGKELKSYSYKDHGSLVSLSNYSTVGNLMGNLMRGSMMIEGRIARMVYISLYRHAPDCAARLLQNRADDAGGQH